MAKAQPDAKPETPAPMPSEGGRSIRDPKTGALTPNPEPSDPPAPLPGTQENN